MQAPGGIARAIEVLRSRGLAERLGRLGVLDAGDLRLQEPSGTRGPSGLLNEAALGELVEATRAQARSAREQGDRLLLIGGDCPVMLGALAGLRDHADARAGLLMLDGHEDAWLPAQSPTGEASDSSSRLRSASSRTGCRLRSTTSSRCWTRPTSRSSARETGRISTQRAHAPWKVTCRSS